jgi:protein-S-isoprenylcysteine O-methyltransferase Ste14
MPLIRIQSERKQQLVHSGVCAFVRHPFYLGGIFIFAGSPLLMGSYEGYSISILLFITLAIRLLREEKMLREELDRYNYCMQKVKYRLLPYIW